MLILIPPKILTNDLLKDYHSRIHKASEDLKAGKDLKLYHWYIAEHPGIISVYHELYRVELKRRRIPHKTPMSMLSHSLGPPIPSSLQLEELKRLCQYYAMTNNWEWFNKTLDFTLEFITKRREKEQRRDTDPPFADKYTKRKPDETPTADSNL